MHSRSSITHVCTTAAFIGIVLVNLFILAQNPFFSRNSQKVSEHEFTYIGEDRPPKYPIGDLDYVAMTLHESMRYMVNRTDPASADEFTLVSSIPKGIGRIRVGPQNRVFLLAISHQLHCLRRIQLGFADRDDPLGTPGHISHCLNYLRQTFLCDAATSLEAGDFLAQDVTKDRIGDTLVCADWETAFEQLDARYEEWFAPGRE